MNPNTIAAPVVDAISGALASGGVLVQQHGGGMMGGGTAGSSWGITGGWSIPWLLLLLGLVVLVAYVAANAGSSGGGDGSTDEAIAELRRRYARGDLSDDEFEERRRTLRRGS